MNQVIENTNKHTPGPWACNMSFGNWHVRQDPVNWDGRGYQGICTIPAERKGTHQGEMFAANARLITAAPELLQELQNIANAKRFDRECFPTDADFIAWAQNRAKYAIAKVIGD